MKSNQISASQSYMVNYYNKPRQGTVEAQRKSCSTLPRRSRNTSQMRQDLRWFLNGDFSLQIKEYLPLLTEASIQQVLLLLSCFSRVRLCVTPWTTAHQAPCPWDSPGKNTGVGCHFLLQCRKVKSESEVAQLCPTPSDPTDCSLPGFSIHGIFQARVLEWGAIAFSKYREA